MEGNRRAEVPLFFEQPGKVQGETHSTHELQLQATSSFIPY